MMKNFVYRKKCAICNNKDTSVLLKKNFLDKSIWMFLSEYYNNNIKESDLKNYYFQLNECEKCGFIFQAYILNSNWRKKIWIEWFTDSRSFDKTNNKNFQYYKDISKKILELGDFFNEMPGKLKVLDYGMGWAKWSIMAKAFGLKVYGYDVLDSRKDFAKKNNISVFNNIADIKNHKFHFINIEEVISYIPEPYELLQVLSNSLEDGGIMYITTPNSSLAKSKLNTNDWIANKDAFHPLEQISAFNINTMHFMAYKLGLKVYKPVRKKKNSFLLTMDKLTNIFNGPKEKNRLALYLKKY